MKAFLDALPPATRRIVDELRRVIGENAPAAEESLLWGSISYHRPVVGGRVKGAVCLITVKRGGVRLDFIHGVRLADPHGLLQGDGVSKRIVPVGSPDDARRPGVAALIREAALCPAAMPEKPRGGVT